MVTGWSGLGSRLAAGYGGDRLVWARFQMGWYGGDRLVWARFPDRLV